MSRLLVFLSITAARVPNLEPKGFTSRGGGAMAKRLPLQPGGAGYEELVVLLIPGGLWFIWVLLPCAPNAVTKCWTPSPEVGSVGQTTGILASIGVWLAVCFTTVMTTTRSALLVSAVEEDHEFLGQVFFQQGWILYKARTLEAAVDFLRRTPVPVVMTERDLPLGNWKDVLAAIQQLPQAPLLIVTARLADELLWAEVLNLGGHDVLSQPFQVSELLWVLGNAWRRGENNWTQALKLKGRPVLAYAQ